MATDIISGIEKPGLILNIDPNTLSKISGCDYSANGLYKTYQDGVLTYTDNTQSAVSSPVSSTQMVLSSSMYDIPREALLDNVIISTDFERDLYALRNSTTKPSGDDIVFYWRCDSNDEMGIEWDDSHDYATGTPSIVHCTSDGYPASYNMADYVVGNSSGQISSKLGQDFNCDGFAVTSLTNLPTKGRVGFWVKFKNTSGDPNYYHIGIGKGYREGGWLDDNMNYCGLSFLQSSESPYRYVPTAFVFNAVAGDPTYMLFATTGIACSPGTWYFVELAFNLTGE